MKITINVTPYKIADMALAGAEWNPNKINLDRFTHVRGWYSWMTDQGYVLWFDSGMAADICYRVHEKLGDRVALLGDGHPD